MIFIVIWDRVTVFIGDNILFLGIKICNFSVVLNGSFFRGKWGMFFFFWWVCCEFGGILVGG